MSDQAKEMQNTLVKWLNPILTAIVAFFLTQLYSEFKEIRNNVHSMNKSIIKLELVSEIKKENEKSDKKDLEDFQNKLNNDINLLKESLHKIDLQINNERTK